MDTDLKVGVKDSLALRKEASPQRADDLFDQEAAELHLRLLFDWLPPEAIFCLATASGDRQGSRFRLSDLNHAYGPLSELDQALDLAEAAVLAGEDVFVAPHPRSSHSLRHETGWREGCVLWVDLDTPDPEPVRWLLELGGFVVASGSPGRHHGYLLLNRRLPEMKIASLNQPLARAWGGDSKWQTNSLLRLAGTRNGKTGRLTEATPVTFPVLPHPRPVSPEELVRRLTELGVPAIVNARPAKPDKRSRQPQRGGGSRLMVDGVTPSTDARSCRSPSCCGSLPRRTCARAGPGSRWSPGLARVVALSSGCAT